MPGNINPRFTHHHRPDTSTVTALTPGRVCPSREPRLSVGFRPRLASEYFRFPRQIPQLTLLSSPRLPVSADDSEHTRLVLPHHNFNLPSGVAAATNAESCWPNKGRNSQFARATRFRS